LEIKGEDYKEEIRSGVYRMVWSEMYISII
jgi:hypothetical protein